MLVHGNFVALPLKIPEPGKPLQAFACAFKSSKNVRGPLAVGERVARSSGFLLGNEIATAFWDCDAWPFLVYEVVIDPPDVCVGQGELMVKTIAFRVVREVPLDEIYGAGAAKIGPLLAEMRRIPWLAPKGPLDVHAVEELVRDVYASAAPYVKARAVPLRIVRHWGEACAADIRVASSRTPGSLSHLTQTALEEGVLPTIEGTELFLPIRALLRSLFAQSYVPMWDAGWEVAYKAFLGWSMKQIPRGDAKAAQRTWNKLREEYTSRRDDLRRAALRAAKEMLKIASHSDIGGGGKAGADGPSIARILNGKGHPPAALEALRSEGLNDVSVDAWNFSLSAFSTARDVLHATIAGMEGAPSHRVLDLFRMGLWPIGDVDGSFLVYAPEPAPPAR